MLDLINNCLLAFLRERFGNEEVAIILEKAALPRTACFASACPFSDDVTFRCLRKTTVVVLHGQSDSTSPAT